MAEFLGRCNGKEVDTCDGGVSEIKKKFVGVLKIGNKWQARVRDPKLRVDVCLGRYRTPEEAAIAVKKKKLEFEEMYKGVNMNIRKGYFNGVKLPFGVRPDNGKWRVQLCHPKLKRNVSLGSYKTCEEAAIVAEMKRAEFLAMQEPKRDQTGVVTEVARKSEYLRDQTGVVKMPTGIRRTPSGKWVARIWDPVAKTRIQLGTYNTFDEAIRSYNKKKDLLAAKMTEVPFDGSKTDETSENFEREKEYDSSTSSSGVDYVNDIALDDELKHGVLVYRPLTSVENSNSESVAVSDVTCVLDVNRVVDLDVVNEYGQLVGEFAELDEQMWLNSD